MTLRKEIAKFHTIAHTLIRKIGVPEHRIYVLYTFDMNGFAPVALVQLVEYFLEHGRSRSSSWQRDVARAVGLFIDFISANQTSFLQNNDRPQILAAFADALVAGTINLNGEDLTDLYWEPKSLSRATHLLNSVTAFSDWLVNRYETTPINPWRKASWGEQIAYWRRFDQRRTHALLSHSYSREESIIRSKETKIVSIRRKRLVTDIENVKFFPDDKIWPLLKQGFVQKGREKSFYPQERLNIRDMLIVILMHGGGLRESEPFHLYVSDIFIEPTNSKSAQVRLYHPEQGKAPEDYIDPISGRQINANREEYLRVKWKFEPRNLMVGRFHAGWKDLKLTNGYEKYAIVHWFPSYWGEVFLTLFKIYINHMRSRYCKHPFLFISHKENVDGDPYTIDSFRQAYSKAVQRIGMESGKYHGTTPHGHRHAYAQRLTNAGLSEQIIQAALHHKSPDSQKIYKEPTAEKINKSLQDASSKMMEDLSSLMRGFNK